mmetsp:Transcript_18251/g.37489  ORF Transcript_18251/g.37489 Transcript_18251/m.37489 type:complete len:326 (+) Transcript_18251:133-1110(+)
MTRNRFHDTVAVAVLTLALSPQVSISFELAPTTRPVSFRRHPSSSSHFLWRRHPHKRPNDALPLSTTTTTSSRSTSPSPFTHSSATRLCAQAAADDNYDTPTPTPPPPKKHAHTLAILTLPSTTAARIGNEAILSTAISITTRRLSVVLRTHTRDSGMDDDDDVVTLAQLRRYAGEVYSMAWDAALGLDEGDSGAGEESHRSGGDRHDDDDDGDDGGGGGPPPPGRIAHRRDEAGRSRPEGASRRVARPRRRRERARERERLAAVSSPRRTRRRRRRGMAATDRRIGGVVGAEGRAVVAAVAAGSRWRRGTERQRPRPGEGKLRK